jgi:glycosyltransferase involved in cell wall biosynthesis
MVTVSIITPCKNIVSEGREEFFRKMMKSLSEQTFQDFEHIVVDGGSEDGTFEILQEYKEKGLIDNLIIKKDNNLHEAINRALKYVNGEFIHIMNSDNYFSIPEFFEKSLKAIREKKVDFTHADRIIIKRDGSKSSIKKGDERIAFFRMPFRWQTMLLKKEIYDEFAPFDEKYEIASDYKFFMQVLLAGKRGHYFHEIFIHSLDGGITADRQKCIDEVSQAIYGVYGGKYGLTLEECRQIYLRKITPELYSKILKNVKNKKIVDSLTYCYKVIQPKEQNEK